MNPQLQTSLKIFFEWEIKKTPEEIVVLKFIFSKSVLSAKINSNWLNDDANVNANGNLI